MTSRGTRVGSARWALRRPSRWTPGRPVRRSLAANGQGMTLDAPRSSVDCLVGVGRPPACLSVPRGSGSTAPDPFRTGDHRRMSFAAAHFEYHVATTAHQEYFGRGRPQRPSRRNRASVPGQLVSSARRWARDFEGPRRPRRWRRRGRPGRPIHATRCRSADRHTTWRRARVTGGSRCRGPVTLGNSENGALRQRARWASGSSGGGAAGTAAGCRSLGGQQGSRLRGAGAVEGLSLPRARNAGPREAVSVGQWTVPRPSAGGREPTQPGWSPSTPCDRSANVTRSWRAGGAMRHPAGDPRGR